MISIMGLGSGSQYVRVSKLWHQPGGGHGSADSTRSGRELRYIPQLIGALDRRCSDRYVNHFSISTVRLLYIHELWWL